MTLAKPVAQLDEAEDISVHKRRKYRIGITVIFIVTMIFAIYVSTMMSISESRLKMRQELRENYYKVYNWMLEQKGILDLFTNVIAASPELLDDYDGMTTFLGDIAQNYPGISALSIGNPDFPHGHPMVANNGWVPDDDYVITERPWYTGAQGTADCCITSPYYDAQTGEYCITFSKVVQSEEGVFYGVFAIDYYFDVLTGILTSGSSSDGYAFLADRNGLLLDHPNEEYNFSASIRNLKYNRTGIFLMTDYDGKLKVCSSITESESGFRLFLVKDWRTIYGNVFSYALLFLLLFGACITAVNLVINRLIRWQRHTNDSLKEVADSAVRAEKAKSLFLSNISHEIRTPINAVLGMNEMILRECREDSLRTYAMNIQASGKMLLFLINDILDMSRIESGKMNIIPVNYEPGELIAELWNVIYLRAQGKGLSLSFWMDEQIPKLLYGDDVRIKQILSNLLTNAVKYTHKGGVELRMSYENAGFKMVTLVISVKDTGTGIRQEDMGKLFGSFQRLDEEHNRNIEGAGLGMSITLSLLKQMGGDIQVESEYQKGSTFTVRIPQRVIDSDPTGDFESVLMRIQAQDQRREYKMFEAPEARVLVVDDNDMNLAVFKALLSRTKIQIDAASSGRQGLEMVKQQPYHLIFMDHMMPEMDGVETLHEIKKLTDYPNAHTPIIALTANALVNSNAYYIKEGFTDLLTKPIDTQQLDQMVQHYLPQELVYILEAKAEEALSIDGEAYARYGISVEQGLHYSTGNMDVYLDLIAMFVRDTERRPKLRQYMESGDMRDYSILVHSLKGNARTLGANALADIAFEHEKASKDGNLSAVKAQWDKLVAVWDSTREGLTLIYRERRGEDVLPAETAAEEAGESASGTGDMLEITQEEFSKVAEMIDNFETDKAIEQLKAWLKSPLPKGTHDLVKTALTTLEDEFDEGRAMKLLTNEK